MKPLPHDRRQEPPADLSGFTKAESGDLQFRFDDPADFEACRSAEAFLEKRGFSVGRMQRGDPRGILFGDYDIQKWSNLSDRDRCELHGIMSGNMRNGPVRVCIFAAAPDEAHNAFMQAIARTAGRAK